MRHTLFWAIRVWKRLAAPLARGFRVRWPRTAQTASAEVIILNSAQPIPISEELPAKAVEEARRIRREFENGERFGALLRRASLGDYTLEVEERYAGGTARHIVSVTSRPRGNSPESGSGGE
ncbi:MAG: hypothetical protein IT161_21280 [Bryobacterales bacterium]|nr:hypothetical protein [Bryobacterales bacterium]